MAPSFARIFFRNAINLGLPALVFDAAGKVASGDELELDLASGRLVNVTRGETHQVRPLSPDLMAIVGAGGLMPLLKQRLAC